MCGMCLPPSGLAYLSAVDGHGHECDILSELKLIVTQAVFVEGGTC